MARTERPSDREAIAATVTAAFGRPDEAVLVDTLRAAGALPVSVVVEEQGRILAHAAASPMRWVDGGRGRVLCLAPVAVDPMVQGRGLGREVAGAAIERARAAGGELLTVLGDPAWYGALGFAAAAPHGLAVSGFDFGEAFLVMELADGALARASGSLAWHAAFDPLLEDAPH